MTRSFRILVNPRSGGGRALDRVRPVTARLRHAGVDVQVVASLGMDHSRDEVGVAFDQGQFVVACGGDGMVASVAGAVVERGGTLGLIPCGRGNDFARQLGLLDATAEDLAQTLLAADPVAVDVIRVGERTVVGSAYAGVDSLASQIVDGAHWLPGPVQYPDAAVRALLTYQPARYELDIDGSRVSVEAYSVVVANSGYYGKGMHVAPAARVDDGLLDVVVIPRASRFTLLRLMPRIYDGSHVEHPEVLVFRGTRVSVRAEAPVTAYGDGERLLPLPITAAVAPGALQVLAPPAPR